MVSDLKSQVAQNRQLVEQISQLEAKNSEINKKYEEYKKSYYKARDERDKLRSEAGLKDDQKPESTDVAQKYESLKSKYRVSSDTLYITLLVDWGTAEVLRKESTTSRGNHKS